MIRVPLDKPLDAELFDAEEEAEASLAEAKLLAEDHGVEVEGIVVRARAIGEAIVDEAAWPRCRPDRHGLRAALAAPVPLLQPDGRLRPPQGALRGDGHRLSAGRAREEEARRVTTIRPRMKAIVVGCGRVGSKVAKKLTKAGWDVTAIDENEEALARLGENWPGGFVVGHGMDVDVLREAGIEEADAVVVATNGDNTNIVVGQVAQKRFGIECTVVRILDPRAPSSTRPSACAPSRRPRPRSRCSPRPSSPA